MKSLVLAEKFSVANDYARVLKCKKFNGYFEGDKYIITYAIGHLFESYQPQDYDEKYKVWNLEDLPIIPKTFKNKLINEKGFIERFSIIKKLAAREDVKEIINGGDCAIEGEGIMYEIYNALGVNKPFKRIWYDDTTDSSIINAFNNVRDSKEFIKYYYAFLLRSRLDYIQGINYSRAVTVKAAQETLSVGRCQTAILRLIVDRDNEIKNFKPKTFYRVIANFKHYEGEYIDQDTEESKIENLNRANEILSRVKGKEGTIISIEKDIKKIYAPSLFTLTDLKITLYNKYSMDDGRVEKALQSLYQDKKIVSYPRTSSNHVSEAISEEFMNRLNVLNFGDFKLACNSITKDRIESVKKNKKYVDNSKITDHYAIVPTLEANEKIYNELNSDEKIVFNEVAMRFLAIFHKPYEYESMRILTKVDIDLFLTKGKRELSKGWKAIYSDGDTEESQEEYTLITNVEENQQVSADYVTIKEGKTTKPKHYNAATILIAMKHFNIGTEATRKNITDILFKRCYLENQGKNIVSTQLGKDLINVIPIEEIKSVEHTAELEVILNDILTKNIDYKAVYEDSIKKIIENIEKIKSSNITIKSQSESIGKCPICKKGEINFNSRTKFYGCSNWKDGCKFSLKNNILGSKIKNDDIIKLISKGTTNQIKGQGCKFKLVLEDKKILIQYIK